MSTAVGYSGAIINTPSEWTEPGWSLPYAFASSIDGVESPLRAYRSVNTAICSGFDANRALSRRSLRARKPEKLREEMLRNLLPTFYDCLSEFPGVSLHVSLNDVEGWRDSTYAVYTEPRYLRITHGDTSRLASIIQGQSWGGGSGIGVLICMDTDFYAVDASRDFSESEAGDWNFFNALLDAGRIGQTLVLNASRSGLLCRMTPAVHETRAAELFSLTSEVAPLHFIRIALPDTDVRAD